MKKNVALLLFWVLCLPLRAVSLDSCLVLSRANYPEVRRYSLIELSEGYSLSNASRLWLPQITFTGQASWQTDVASYPDELSSMLEQRGLSIPGIRKDQYKLQLDVYQSIWDGGKSRLAKQTAQSRGVEQRAQSEVSMYKLDGRVEEIYFGLLLLDRQLSVTEANISLLEEHLRAVRVRVDNGVLLASDADAVEVSLLSAQQRQSEQKVVRAAYCRMLSLLTGVDMSGETFEAPQDISSARTEINASHPSLRLIDAKRGMLLAERYEIKSASMPRIGFFAQGWYGYPGLNMFENMMNSKWSWNAVLGLRLTWNISSFYTRGNSLGALRVKGSTLDLEEDLLRFNTRLEATRENGEILRLRELIQSDRRIADLRGSIRRAAETQHENGVITTAEMLQKITDETNAQSQLELHRTEMLKYQYKLQHTTGE